MSCLVLGLRFARTTEYLGLSVCATLVQGSDRRDNHNIMAIIKPAKGNSSRQVDTLCVSVEDVGIMATKFGSKPMLRFTYESQELNEYGSKRRYTRLFHKHAHEKSSLSIAVKSWTGRDLANEADDIDEIDFQAFVKVPARLTLEPGNVKDGKRYENIVNIEGMAAVSEAEVTPKIEDVTTELKEIE